MSANRQAKTDMTFTPQSSYSYDEIIECGEGKLFGPGNALLPLPPMLMFDRITQINDNGGVHGKGQVIAEFDINPDLWFFECHFKGDPVMPGCLGLDALWQLTGFWLGWTGAQGSGRAIGAGEVKLTEQILPSSKKVTYTVDIKRFINRKLVLGVADGHVDVDGKTAFEVSDMKVGLFDNSASQN
jgi:3-hydroxyacyl-[acyl-carrier protein] dehydratase/trans-2-decenoyl-[acyl-carrier protein] isomerase